MHEVGQQDAPAGEIPKGKAHIALGVRGAEIDHRQEPTTGTSQANAMNRSLVGLPSQAGRGSRSAH